MGLFSSWFGRREPRGFRVRKTDERPDIVLFLTDEQRHDEVGYASGGYFETPVLDALAARGVVFETAYSSSTVCVPSRVGLLTGLDPLRAPTQDNGLALREGFWTIARGLKVLGYETALVGKMHFSPMYANHGFDHLLLAENLVPHSGYGPGDIDDYHRWLLWQGLADHPATHMFGTTLEEAAAEYGASYLSLPFPYGKEAHCIGWIASQAIERIRSRRGHGAPLFLIVSFPRPHAPYDPAEPFASLYDPKDARLPGDGPEVNEGLPEKVRAAFRFSAGEMFNSFPVASLAEPIYRRTLTYVRALVRQIDDAMGDVLRCLDLDRTVVFFTSDHGTYAGHRGVLGKVPWIPFEDLVRVPFVCAAPGAMAGKRVMAPVQTFDFAPSCLDYAGFDHPADLFDGESLRPFVQGYPAPADRPVFSAASVGWPMVRSGAHKLVRATGGDVLFDLTRDPGELRNLADEPASAEPLARLREALDESLARPSPPLLARP